MIRRLALTCIATGAIATGALAGAAYAADLPVTPAAGYYPRAVTPTPYYDWTGVYIGANAGAAWASEHGSTTTDVPTGALISTTNGSSTGFAGGGQIGANLFITPSYVFGIEADFDSLTNKNSAMAPDGSNRHDGKVTFLSTARGRFGLTADRFMFFVTGGAAWGEDQVTRTQITGTVNNAVPGTSETARNIRVGWTAGTGVEYGIARNWTARLEYIYAQLDGLNYTFPLAERSTAASLQSVSEFRIGVNYKFGWGGPTTGKN